MISFHGDKAIKDKYLKRVLAHQKADEIIKGTYWEESFYWEEGKGCAVGCTVHSDNHLAFEEELGIPEWLAILEDTLFEGMPNKDAKVWPYKFLNAIPVGVDLDKVKAPFLIFVLESTLSTFDHEKNPNILKSINDVIYLYKNNGTETEFSAAYAGSAADACADACAADACAAYAATRQNAYSKFADKLVEIFKALEAPVFDAESEDAK